MKVLVIDEWLPWPLESGKKIRTFNLINRLSRCHEILYMAYADSSSDTYKIKEMEKHDVRVLPVKDTRTIKWSKKFYIEVAMNFFSSQPFSTAYHIKNNFIIELKKALDYFRPQLVHCEWTNLAPFLEHVPGVPWVISSHNVESDIWRRLGENGSNILERIVGYSQARKIERLEREWYPKADVCIAVSRDDQLVIESYGAKVEMIDNGVDIEYYDNTEQMEVDPNSLIFTASFDTFSNQDGAIYFLEKIYPLIKRKLPKTHFWLVGKDPSKKLINYSINDNSIHITGKVDDVRKYISQASLCVVPLRIGGGSRLKILEALAMKKPVVSTSIGAEGLNIEDGKNILIADDPIDFANAVFRCITDSSLKDKLSAQGYSLVRNMYDWNILVKKMDRIWCSLI